MQISAILQQATQLLGYKLLGVEDKVGLKIRAWRKMHVNYSIEAIQYQYSTLENRRQIHTSLHNIGYSIFQH